MMLGMSQEMLGENLGVTFQQVQKYEKGTNRVSASKLYQISQLLEAPVSFFFEKIQNQDSGTASGFAEDGGPEYSIDILATPESMHLNRAFSKVKDPKVRKKIVALVKSLADEAEQS